MSGISWPLGHCCFPTLPKMSVCLSVSITLQNCNSSVILRKLSRLSIYRLDNENILAIDKDIQSSIH